MKILIMGLPGTGKTWLGERLGKHFGVPYWDADDVRRIYNCLLYTSPSPRDS